MYCQLAATSGLSVQVLLAVSFGLFHQQVKYFCEKQHQHSHRKMSFFTCGTILLYLFFTEKRADIGVPS
jgi:hypothetical protein